MTSVHDWAAPNPVRTNRSGLIGKAVDRYEGPLKVTGTDVIGAGRAQSRSP